MSAAGPNMFSPEKKVETPPHQGRLLKVTFRDSPPPLLHKKYKKRPREQDHADVTAVPQGGHAGGQEAVSRVAAGAKKHKISTGKGDEQ